MSYRPMLVLARLCKKVYCALHMLQSLLPNVHLPCVLPIEIFSYLLSLVRVPSQARNWFLLGTLFVHFATMPTTSFSRDCNVVCALLAEECEMPEGFVQSLRASTSNAYTCPPKGIERRVQ